MSLVEKQAEFEFLFGELIGKTVLVRTDTAGVHFGTLVKGLVTNDHYSIKLSNTKRIYSWAGACSLSQLALEGTENKETRISVKIPSNYLQAIEIMEMTDYAISQFSELPTWKIENTKTPKEITNF